MISICRGSLNKKKYMCCIFWPAFWVSPNLLISVFSEMKNLYLLILNRMKCICLNCKSISLNIWSKFIHSNEDFDQRFGCAAPKRWSKYKTYVVSFNFKTKINLILLCKSHSFHSVNCNQFCYLWQSFCVTFLPTLRVERWRICRRSYFCDWTLVGSWY